MKKQFLMLLLMVGAFVGQVQGAAAPDRQAVLSSLGNYLTFVSKQEIDLLLSDGQKIIRRRLQNAFNKLEKNALEEAETAALRQNLEDFSENVVAPLLVPKTTRTVGKLSVIEQQAKEAAEKRKLDFERLAQEAKDALAGKKAPKKTPPPVAPKKSAEQLAAEKAAEEAKVAAEKAAVEEAARVVAERAEQARITAEIQKIAQEEFRLEQLRLEKEEQERLTRVRIVAQEEAERVAELARVEKLRLEEEELARTEAARVAELQRLEQEQTAVLEELAQQERERLAKVEEERIAAEKIIIERERDKAQQEEANQRRINAVKLAQGDRFKDLHMCCTVCGETEKSQCKFFAVDPFCRIAMKFNGTVDKYPLDFEDTFYLWKSGFVDVLEGARDEEYSPLFRLLYDCVRGFSEDPNLTFWEKVKTRKTAYYDAAKITPRPELKSWAEKIPLLISALNGKNLIFNDIKWGYQSPIFQYFLDNGTVYEKNIFKLGINTQISEYMKKFSRYNLENSRLGRQALQVAEDSGNLKTIQAQLKQEQDLAEQARLEKIAQQEQLRLEKMRVAEDARLAAGAERLVEQIRQEQIAQQAEQVRVAAELSRVAAEQAAQLQASSATADDDDDEARELAEQQALEAEEENRKAEEAEARELAEQQALEAEEENRKAEEAEAAEASASQDSAQTPIEMARKNIVTQLNAVANQPAEARELVVTGIPGFQQLFQDQQKYLTLSMWPEESPFHTIALVATQQVINYVCGVNLKKLGDLDLDRSELVGAHFEEMYKTMLKAGQIDRTLNFTYETIKNEIKKAVNAIVQLNKNFRIAVDGAQADTLLGFGSDLGTQSAIAEILQATSGQSFAQGYPRQNALEASKDVVGFVCKLYAYLQQKNFSPYDCALPNMAMVLADVAKKSNDIQQLTPNQIERILEAENLRLAGWGTWLQAAQSVRRAISELLLGNLKDQDKKIITETLTVAGAYQLALDAGVHGGDKKDLDVSVRTLLGGQLTNAGLLTALIDVADLNADQQVAVIAFVEDLKEQEQQEFAVAANGPAFILEAGPNGVQIERMPALTRFLFVFGEEFNDKAVSFATGMIGISKDFHAFVPVPAVIAEIQNMATIATQDDIQQMINFLWKQKNILVKPIALNAVANLIFKLQSDSKAVIELSPGDLSPQ